MKAEKETQWPHSSSRVELSNPFYHVRFKRLCALDYEYSGPPFFLRDSKASETRSRVKITHARKGDTRRGETIFPSSRRVSPFLARADFHARLRFARSTIPEEKWGTTRSLFLFHH